MAVTIQNGLASLTRNPSAWFNVTIDWTRCFWHRYPSGQSDDSEVWGYDANGSFIGNYISLDNEATGVLSTLLTIDTWDGTNYLEGTPQQYDVGSGWRHIAIRYTASTTTLNLIVDGIIRSTLVSNLALVGNQNQESLYGALVTGNVEAYEYFRVWQAALTLAEITAEMNSVDPVRTLNLLSDTRIAGKDYLGDLVGGHTWTMAGTCGYADGPLPPANITPALATIIHTLPFSTTIDVQDAPTGVGHVPSCVSSEVFEVWFKYTTGPTENLISVKGDNVDLYVGAFYSPVVQVWDNSLNQFITHALNPADDVWYCYNGGGDTWMQIVVTPNTTYYFQVVHKFPTSKTLGSRLTFALEGLVTRISNVNTLAINDDQDVWPITFFDATGVSRSLPFPAGENVGILPPGKYCVPQSEFSTAVSIYDSNFQTILGSFNPGVSAPNGTDAICSNWNDKFYVAIAVSGFPRVYQISATGVLLNTYNITIAGAIAEMTVALDDSKIYYCLVSESKIRVWLTGTNLPGPDLVASVPGYTNRNTGSGLTFPDGSVLFSFYDTIVPISSPNMLQHYDSSGTLLHQYDLNNTTEFLDRFQMSTDYTSFWVWVQNVHPSEVRRYRLSDGALLDTVVIPITSTGHDHGDVGLPGYRFGVSSSCPLFVLFASVGSTTPPPVPAITGGLFKMTINSFKPVETVFMNNGTNPGTGSTGITTEDHMIPIPLVDLYLSGSTD